jgi:hypothetical protein
MTYSEAKDLAIDLVDDFTKFDVAKDYGKKFDARTKFEKLGISAPIAATMPHRVNKVLRAKYSDAANIGALDMVNVGTIGDFIQLFCDHAGQAVPKGEPT